MAQAAGQAMRRDAAEPASSHPAAVAGGNDPWLQAPFDQGMGAELRAWLARLAPGQRLWLSGYLAGTLAAPAQPAHAGADTAAAPVTILFGSQSGNSEALAKRLARSLDARHVPSRVLDMLDCRKADLEQARRLVVIVSTHGDGDPPERALPFFDLVGGRKAPRLAQARFAVLALGDSSYEHYCATGRRLDARLEELGAQRLLPRVECDVDFEATASGWLESICSSLGQAGGVAGEPPAAQAPRAVTQVWTRNNPFMAEVLANQALTARGSSKEVRHVELSIDGADLQYTPGDALGIVPRNALAEVEAVLARSGFRPEVPVEHGGRELTLRDALLQHFEVGVLSVGLLRRYAQATHCTELLQLAGDAAAVKDYLRGRNLHDLIARHPPHGLDAQAFLQLLSPLAPRLYSIASSPRATPDEMHLTVGVVAYESRGSQRRGVVSGAVAHLQAGDGLPVYLHRNEAFRMPVDPTVPMVMIGAGTGVAPYRGFLAEREASGATGRNWLVFGDRSFELDFLYQAEWLAWRRRGLLQRLDLAFSRDQPEKCYVQHRLREQGATLWQWLQEGAHLYVCGDAERMAPDVECALRDMARQHGGLEEEAAHEWLRQLQRERRYQRDVY